MPHIWANKVGIERSYLLSFENVTKIYCSTCLDSGPTLDLIWHSAISAKGILPAIGRQNGAVDMVVAQWQEPLTALPYLQCHIVI